VEAAGIEPLAQVSGKAANPSMGGAESGALGARGRQDDCGLAAVVEAWPKLPNALRAGILAIIQAAG